MGPIAPLGEGEWKPTKSAAYKGWDGTGDIEHSRMRRHQTDVPRPFDKVPRYGFRQPTNAADYQRCCVQRCQERPTVGLVLYFGDD